MWGPLSTTCSNLLQVVDCKITQWSSQWELRVAVDHNQLCTMAPETVDPSDWSHPTRTLMAWAVPPESFVHSINLCSLSGNRPCNFSMRGNNLAYAATHGKSINNWPRSLICKMLMGFISLGHWCRCGFRSLELSLLLLIVIVGQTVMSISSKTLAYDCLSSLELCTASMIATSFLGHILGEFLPMQRLPKLFLKEFTDRLLTISVASAFQVVVIFIG